MSGKSIQVGVLFRKHGYSGVVTVFNGGLHIWSETTPFLRSTMAGALRDAEIRRAALIDRRE
jgi:hypothetical protein